ncbi:MAG TPA: NAD(P)-dependent alcohol dehydrogenase [Intrasporangium sp.]|uniref:NAD(P)-dependent alcohol dehydrogenase n=1 Tax=Intrasporangium sp. TaxID=1925024 RepID=UPI002D788E33|nr:NAD(P)-dependent alcohol dehydrogenase [Intrasporangium sp.]HET7397168.1 NAD(P)-dependent alcohol dehydrogenase [Intrasporangium sp.]
MRAAVLTEPGTIHVERRTDPRPGADEVLVRVLAVGVCGSDVHYYEHGRIGSYVVDAPLVLGHEAAGVIEAVGDGVDPRRVGQRVSIEPGRPDFTCPECLAGRYNLCPRMSFHATPPIDGSLAELVVVHSAFAHAVPDDVSDAAAALLEPLSVAIWACQKGQVTAGDAVLVTGAGPVGLAALQAARASGATDVTVWDINAERLAVARRLGATRTRDLSQEPAGDTAIDRTTEPVRPRVLLECSGHPGTTRAALAALAPAGRAVLVGMGGDDLTLPLSLLQERELTVTGTFRYANTWPTAINLAATGAVDLDSLVTGHFPLGRTADALTAARRDPQAIKSVIHPQD